MKNNRALHARRIWPCLMAATVLLFFTGCEDMKITNLTPSALPANPSQIYTFSARFKPKSRGFVESTLQAQIVIDGQIHKMDASPVGENIFEFDYQIPVNRTSVNYYFLAIYDVSFKGRPIAREAFTEVTTATLRNRQVLSMIANRGPVGARIGVVGQGFTAQDTVTLNDQPTRTVFESSNALSFFVPAVAPGRNYQVAVVGPNDNQVVGAFRVDPLGIDVFPATLDLVQGQTESITFTLPQNATIGGLLLDVTTDVPDSVIMPEVFIPAGSNSVTVPVSAGLPGSGSLYLTGFGSGEVVIPITVQ